MAGQRRVMPAAPAPESIGAWLERHTARAPAPLRARVVDYAATAAGDVAAPSASGSAAESLACAGAAALARVLAQPGDRSAALDLLAADALVTLALLAQALHAPERLGAFADELLRAGLPVT